MVLTAQTKRAIWKSAGIGLIKDALLGRNVINSIRPCVWSGGILENVGIILVRNTTRSKKAVRTRLGRSNYKIIRIGNTLNFLTRKRILGNIFTSSVYVTIFQKTGSAKEEIAAIMPMVNRNCTVITFSKWDSASLGIIARKNTLRFQAKVKKKKNRINQEFSKYQAARYALRISIPRRKSLTVSPAATLFA